MGFHSYGTTPVVNQVISVVDKQHHITKEIMLIDISHMPWGSGGNGTQHGNRGARGREGVVVVHEFYG